MSTETIVGVRKICCKCGRDVTGAARMKDHDGRYWCVPCGEADRRHQAHDVAGICEGCGESFSRSQLMQIAGQSLCLPCRKKKFRHAHQEGRVGLLGSIKSLLGKK